MSIAGLTSVTIATISYLVALCLFFNPTKFPGPTYFMLCIFFLSGGIMLLRIFQFLTYRGKLGKNNCYYQYRRLFRIATIVLGIVCALLVVGITVLLIQKTMETGEKWERKIDKVNNATEKIKDRIKYRIKDRLEQRRQNDSTNSTSTNSTSTNSTSTNSTSTNSTSANSTSANSTSANSSKEGGFIERMKGRWRGRVKGRFNRKKSTRAPDNLIMEPVPEDGTQSANGREAAPDYPTTTPPNVSNYTFTFSYSTSSSYSTTGGPMVDDLVFVNKNQDDDSSTYDLDEGGSRIGNFIEKKVSEKETSMYIVAGFLALSCLGHVVNVCVAICCNGDLVYLVQGDEEQEEEQEEEAEPLTVKTDNINGNLTEKDPAKI